MWNAISLVQDLNSCYRVHFRPLHLYVSRKEGGRRLVSIQDSVDASIQFEDYITKNQEMLITATRNNLNNTVINRTKIACKQKWEEKQSKKQNLTLEDLDKISP